MVEWRVVSHYLENKLLLISINFTPKNSHDHCLTKLVRNPMFSRYPHLRLLLKTREQTVEAVGLLNALDVSFFGRVSIIPNGHCTHTHTDDSWMSQEVRIYG